VPPHSAYPNGIASRSPRLACNAYLGCTFGNRNNANGVVSKAKRGKISRRSDVYSLGAMLYHLLTGRPPLVGEALTDTLDQVVNSEPVSPRLLNPSVPRDLETICLKCLEKEPEKRYATAQTLAAELDRFLNNEPVHARAVTRSERLWRWCRRKLAIAVLSAATALLLLSITIGSPIAVYRINKALRRAEAGELLARQKQYASDMNLAHQAIIGGDFFRALRFLKRNRPENNSDLRGWEWRYFWNQCQGEPEVILGYHSNGVYAAGFLPDGKPFIQPGMTRWCVSGIFGRERRWISFRTKRPSRDAPVLPMGFGWPPAPKHTLQIKVRFDFGIYRTARAKSSQLTFGCGQIASSFHLTASCSPLWIIIRESGSGRSPRAGKSPTCPPIFLSSVRSALPFPRTVARWPILKTTKAILLYGTFPATRANCNSKDIDCTSLASRLCQIVERFSPAARTKP